MTEPEIVKLSMVCHHGEADADAQEWRDIVLADGAQPDRLVSWCVYQHQYLPGPIMFDYTGIQSDMWARVNAQMSVYNDDDIDDDDVSEEKIILKVSVECDRIEDGFARIYCWVKELLEWQKALALVTDDDNDHDLDHKYEPTIDWGDDCRICGHGEAAHQ